MIAQQHALEAMGRWADGQDGRSPVRAATVRCVHYYFFAGQTAADTKGAVSTAHRG